jgi:hypothetical protein
MDIPLYAEGHLAAKRSVGAAWAAGCFLTLLGCCASPALSQTFTTFQMVAGNSTYPNSINLDGSIAGAYLDANSDYM